MEVFEHKEALRAHLESVRKAEARIGLVPTMGNLHEGHLALIRAARQGCDHVVASIFVNPLQFGPNEDFTRYPRTLERDAAMLQAEGCHTLFAPTVNEIYPQGLESQTVVSVPELSELYCGATRPGHFNGVATIVCKLFNIVAPHEAFFGLKDYQQLLIIRKMAADLCLPLRIHGIPIQREASGLALSSRNAYLTEQQKAIAPALYRQLRETRKALLAGSLNFSDLEQNAQKTLEGAGMRVDYFNIAHAATLLPATPYDKDLVILGAVYLGSTRLIDNIGVTLPA